MYFFIGDYTKPQIHDPFYTLYERHAFNYTDESLVVLVHIVSSAAFVLAFFLFVRRIALKSSTIVTEITYSLRNIFLKWLYKEKLEYKQV
jgi:hypothetical protein